MPCARLLQPMLARPLPRSAARNFLKITATRLLTAKRDRFGDSFNDNVHHYWFSTASPPASYEGLFSRGQKISTGIASSR